MNRQRLTQIALLLLRVVAGFLFFQAGATKVFGWFGGMPGGKTIALASQIGVGGVIEVVGGLLIVVGLCVRPVAFVLSGQMAVAYFQFHQPHGLWPAQNHGLGAVLFCFIFLYFAAAGGGDISIDGWRAKKTKQPRELVASLGELPLNHRAS